MYMIQYDSPVGKLTVASDGENITGLWIEGQKYFPETLSELGDSQKGESVLEKAKEWLDMYFAGERPSPGLLPLRPAGSGFRKLVWDILLEIPYGSVSTYGEIAREVSMRLGRESMSAQAVGGAVGHNPISIVIPCHRVLGAGGDLTGYAGGIDKKIWLLRHEGIDVTSLHAPKSGNI